MNDQFVALITIAAVTLLATALWALAVGLAYWDLQRRRQAGQRVNTLAWMAVVALLPVVGWVAYAAARALSRPSLRAGDGAARTGSPRLTKIKKLPASGAPGQPLSTILAADVNQVTAVSRSSQPGPAAGPARRTRLVFSVTGGPAQGKSFPVEHFPAVIGRDFEADVRLEQDAGVSRQHAQVYQVNGGLRIRDLESRNGTWVNGKLVNDHPLKAGDRIEVGKSSLVVKLVDGADG